MKIIYVNCGERDKYGSDLRSSEHYLSSSEIKAYDVYHNNYLMQYLKVIYADGNRSLISSLTSICLRSTSHRVFSSSRREESYILVRQCTILHFGNFAGAVWQDASHLVSWYLYCAVLSLVCCEMQRRWVNFFFIYIRENFYFIF